MFEIIKPGTKIDFVGKRHIWVSLSILFILATIVLFFTRGLNYGIDFTGGVEIGVRVPAQWNTGKLRSELENAKIQDAKVIQIGTPEQHEFLIRVQGHEGDVEKIEKEVMSVFSKGLNPGEYEKISSAVVGAAAGKALRVSGFLSMLYALICILIYVTIRFDIRYAPGAVLALFHDSMFVIGILILTQTQFDLTVLAAILALIGYSNNDTIIVYDRVRETLEINPNMNIVDAVNQAANETLGRTIMTSICTLISAAMLWLIGGKVIQDFAFTFMIGLVIGTYSSIFIASSIMIYMAHYQERKKLKLAHKT